MAPQYKLTYFDFRALAEPARLVFALKGVEYEDNRIARDNWPQHKANYPWGSLPVLEEGGKMLAQSNAILRYLGKKYNLVGDNDFETAQVDELLEAMVDLRKESFSAVMEKDEAKKATLVETVKKETYPKYLKRFSEILEKNGGKYFVGKNITVADINIANYLQIFSEVFEGILNDYPLVKAHQDTVFNTPGIKEWVAKRPKTEF